MNATPPDCSVAAACVAFVRRSVVVTLQFRSSQGGRNARGSRVGGRASPRPSRSSSRSARRTHVVCNAVPLCCVAHSDDVLDDVHRTGRRSDVAGLITVGPARSLPFRMANPSTNEAVLLGFLALIMALVGVPASTLNAQRSFAAQRDACRCEPDNGKPRRPRFLLPIAGGIGILPISLAARDSQLPSLAVPSLVDIRDNTPRNALEGERALAVGALAPDTATALPTLMLMAVGMLAVGGYFLVPRRRGRRARSGWRIRRSGAHGGWRLRTVHRRRVGVAIAGGGGLMLMLGTREYAEGAEAQRRARAEWFQVGGSIVRLDAEPRNEAIVRQIESRPTVVPVTASAGIQPTSAVPLPVLAVSGREIRRGTPVARLLIPTIDLDEIVMEGVGPVELNGGPGHFPGSVLPGGAGNSILSAHRDRHFRRVGELAVGSRIRTETHSGATEWVVTERRIVSRDTPSLFEESDPTLTLTTCWPLRYFGPAPDRLLIIAKPARQ